MKRIFTRFDELQWPYIVILLLGIGMADPFVTWLIGPP